jgi:hypothetical protein
MLACVRGWVGGRQTREQEKQVQPPWPLAGNILCGLLTQVGAM